MRPGLTIVLFFLIQAAIGQTDYPKAYFRNPLDIPMSLAGNFGELRPNHYHMGLDIKTNQRENLPVYAAAEGWISRIRIEPGGFGRVIYITHPNGYTTLYAHLNAFAAKLETFVKQQQYARESWKIQLDFPPGQFPVKKGEFIALSGNTGGSQAPHLHFEIRRTADDVNVNPLLFGLPLTDNVKPQILRLAVYDRTRSVYEQDARVFPVKPVSTTSYATVPGIIKVNAPVISLAISAFDTHTGSSNKNGIYEATLSVNDKDEESFTMNNISYNATRNVNAHIDYRYRARGGAYLQHLSELPGYLNSIYTNGDNHGVIDISDGDLYDVVVDVADAAGNLAELKTMIQYEHSGAAAAPAAEGKMFYPLSLDGYESDHCEFYLGERCLYDSVHIRYGTHASGDPAVVSDVQDIGAPYIPLQDSFLVRIRPLTALPDADREHTVMQWLAGAKTAVRKVQWQHDWASARFREFGSFQLVVDDEPPQIVPGNFSDGANLSRAGKLFFRVKDNLNSVRNVRAELDGKWLRFSNDKFLAFIYEFDEHCLPGTHQLKIIAEDEAGNRTEESYTFLR